MPRKIPINSDKSDIVVSDWHIPFHDGRVINAFMNDIAENEYEHIILNGDMIDAYELSRFDKPPITLVNNLFLDEIRAFRHYMARIRELQPKAKIIYLPGNHEYRWYKNLHEIWGKSLYALARLGINYGPEVIDPSPSQLFGLDDFDIEFHIDPNPEKSIYRLRDKINIAHGWRVLKWSCATPKAYVTDYGGNWLIGHTHKLGVYYRTLASGETNVAMEGGCMCKDMDYNPIANWQRGYIRLHWNGPKFRPEIMTWV